MEQLDFEFIKSRGIGDLISDYFSLLKQIFKHFNKSIFKFILPFLAVFLLLFFLGSTLGVDIFYNKEWKTPTVLIILIACGLAILFFYFLFIPTFGIEYMFLLEEKGNTDFTGREVWQNVKKNLGKYIIFFLASILVGLIIAIPVVIVWAILFFIPFLGSIAMGILGSCISVVFISALFLYLKGREGVFDSFPAAYRLVKKKFFAYGLAAYIFRFLLMICLGLLTIIPGIIIAIITYNTIGFNEQVWISFGGKMLLSIGGTILILMGTISTLYSMGMYALIYFSSLETTHKEGTLSQIDQIGHQEDEDETQQP